MRGVGQNLRAAGKSLMLALATLLVSVGDARAQGPFRDAFETSQIVWRDGGGDVALKLESHERSSRAPHSGAACEFIQYSTAATGTQAFLYYPIGRATVIPELTPSVWVRADRPGIQLQARIVLPRTRDPRTGEPITTVVAGPAYARTGDWQQLRFGDLPTLLTRQARVLRLQNRIDIDTGEAYVDRILLNTYTGGGRTQLSIDDLEVAGFVGQHPTVNQTLPGMIAPSFVPETGPKRTIELTGSVLLVDGRPFFPRMIEYRGEPLAYLRQLGFNGIQLDGFPAPELIAEATQERLWIIAPPPRPPGLEDPQTILAPMPDLTTTQRAVLAWNIGTQLTGRELEVTKRWSDYLRRFDRTSGRPLLVQAETDLRTYSRYVDMLVLHRQPLGTSFELNDYGTWLRERPKAARPGTPFWSTVQTDLAPVLREQCAGLSNGRASTPAVSAEQIRMLAYHAVAAGSRGLLFSSATRLDAQDAQTRQRALSLELINYELEAIETWGALGNLIATTPVTTAAIPVPGTTSMRVPGSTQKFVDYTLPPLPNVQIALLQTERARLLLPLWSGRGAQYVPSQLAANGASFIAPGVPESNDIYRLTPGGLPPARHTRVTGGIRVAMDELSATSQLVITQDPVVMGSLLRQMSARGGRMLQLQRELTALELQRTVEVDALLTAQGRGVPQARQYLTTAQRDLQAAEAQTTGRDLSAAYDQYRRVLRPLQLLQRAHWEQSAKAISSPVTAPLAANFNTLPAQGDFMNQLAAWRPAGNLLRGGECEDLDRMLQNGWQHFEHPQSGTESRADLTYEVRPRSPSRQSLRLAARTIPGQEKEGLVESPPVWITSPSVSVDAGTWLRISGWIYTRSPITASLDGVMIIDSIGGEPLAERIGEAGNWRVFTLYRFAPRTEPVSLTIALTGLGEVWIDDLAIEPLLPQGLPLPGQTIPAPPRQAWIGVPPRR